MFLAAIGLVLWILLRPRTAAAMPPGVVARAELGKLINEPETGIELSKVSQILREYMIAAFDLSPGEFTTAEFCAMLVQSEKIGPDSAQLVSNFLHECDQRKFAPGQGSPPMNAVNRAVEIVSHMEERRKQFMVKK